MKNKILNKKERNSMTKVTNTSSSMKESMISLTKQQAKYVKVGTNVSALPGQNNSLTKKSIKQKKPQTEQTDKKQKTIRLSQVMTSTRTKGLKFKIKTKKSCNFEKEKYYGHQNIDSVAEDCEEYCLVEDSFVPIVSKTEHQKLQDIMRSTADTTKRVEQLHRSTLRKMFPFQLKKSQKTAPKQDSSSQQSMAVRSKKVSIKQAQIQASPFYAQIGIQYSQRPNFLKPIIQVIKQKQSIEVDIQTEDIVIESATTTTTISPIKLIDEILISEQQTQQQHSVISQNKPSTVALKKQQTLSDLLLKLEFKHLPNDTSFTTLSKTQKQHYTDLLSSLISKLNCSPREKSPRQIKSKKQIEIQQVKLIPFQEIKIKHEKLQMQVFKRQSVQMNWIPRRVDRNLQKDNDDIIDTSLMAVNNFLLNFFCYIELNYMQDFLKNIRRQFGPSYIFQFQRVTRKLTKPISYHKVLQAQAFEQFAQQLSSSSPYQRIHLQSIFDYTNQLLDTYRPYYQHYGQPFPWAVKIYNNICQYVIDQSSLQIIFVEIKQNIEKSVSMLCGLLVQEKFCKDISSEKNPLTIVRRQKEKIMIQQWLNSKSDENHDIECEATMVLNQVSEDIYNRLLVQVMQEIKCL